MTIRDIPREKNNSQITSRWSVGPKDKSRKFVTKNMSRDKENLRNLQWEKKFDYSIIRDINPETLRDSPCDEKFDNSQIRDNKTVTLRDAPCENKPIR